MRIENSSVPGTQGIVTVHVEANELDCGQRRLPYAACIGTIGPKGRIRVWTPAASKPRGYRAAAEALLLSTAARLALS